MLDVSLWPDARAEPANGRHYNISQIRTMISEHYLQRFGGVARLYGQRSLEALAEAHMVVVGLGGVGSWAAEALARSGVGELTLIDMDDICVSNSNRQIHALNSNVGRSKNAVLRDRLLDINPELAVHSVDDFLTTGNMRELIGGQHHVVVDCMDAVHIKAGLVAYASAIKIRLITVGSSGGKRDPMRIRVSDLANTKADPMLAKIRTQLYQKYGFARDSERKFRVDAIFSDEHMVYPKPDGSVCQEKTFVDGGVKLDCASGFGSAVMVTGSFGFAAAHQAIKRYLTKALAHSS